MAAKKLLRFVNNTITEVFGTQTSAGAANGGDIVALNDQGVLDNSVLPSGIGADTRQVLASEALSPGNLVNVYNNAGTANVRKADATTAGKEANGFVLATVANGAQATVYFEGTDDQLTGLTPGRQYLSTTPGTCTSTPPSASGNIVQRVGVAVSATAMNAEFDSQPVTLA